MLNAEKVPLPKDAPANEENGKLLVDLFKAKEITYEQLLQGLGCTPAATTVGEGSAFLEYKERSDELKRAPWKRTMEDACKKMTAIGGGSSLNDEGGTGGKRRSRWCGSG